MCKHQNGPIQPVVLEVNGPSCCDIALFELFVLAGHLCLVCTKTMYSTCMDWVQENFGDFTVDKIWWIKFGECLCYMAVYLIS